VRRLLKFDPFCAYCRKEMTHETATLDHVIPKCRGGSNKSSNLVLACWECNQEKADKIIKEYRCPKTSTNSAG
jgi:5-methylcytosine-specific restriction endonuclease McrA